MFSPVFHFNGAISLLFAYSSTYGARGRGCQEKQTYKFPTSETNDEEKHPMNEITKMPTSCF